MQVLVLGFEYNTEAEYLITHGILNLLDVITRVNGKQANTKTFLQETRKVSLCNLVVNMSKSISLPEMDPKGLLSLLENGTLWL